LEVNSQIPVAQVEPHLLGTDNRQIGAWLMQVWGMPKEFTATIRWHHKEDYSQPHAEYPNLVLIANRLLCSLGIGNETTDRLPTTIMSSLGLSEEKALASLNQIAKSHRQLNDLSRALYV
jgi:HD-like signal output (HDOD) protein